MPKKENDLAAKMRKCIRSRENGKKLYARADALLAEIAEEVKPGEKIALNGTGRAAMLIDRFDGKNIVWQPCGARRWDLKVTEA